MADEPTALDYFSGGVPGGEFFRMTIDDIRAISGADDRPDAGINRLQELCFIGLLAYFEAFCKDHFASILNLEPSFIARLKAAGRDVSLDADHIATFGQGMRSTPSSGCCRIGIFLCITEAHSR